MTFCMYHIVNTVHYITGMRYCRQYSEFSMHEIRYRFLILTQFSFISWIGFEDLFFL